MAPRWSYLSFICMALQTCASTGSGGGYNVRPFQVDLSGGVSHMLDLVRNTELPHQPEYPGVGDTAGIGLQTLKSLQAEWIDSFDWKTEQESMNKFHHYLAEIEGQTAHFIHEKSDDPDAIPILLNHGWPGSFLEFLPIIKNLTEGGTTGSGKKVAFHVVVPSLPGFTFSSPEPKGWSIENDTARVWNTLMTKVLGYDTYAVHGTDWGCVPTYSLYQHYNQSVRAAHFDFIPFFPLTPAQLKAEGISLDSSLEKNEEQRFVDWYATGQGYSAEQGTKPNTIGLALYDNPVGQLAWIAEKFISWSDPRAGSPPSLLTHNEILTSVSLYYLSKCFMSAEYIYFQNPDGFKTTYTKAKTDAPMLFTTFKYNVAFWPRALVEKVGNLKVYRNRKFGGHFAGLDNPSGLLQDLREIGTYWEARD